MTRRPRPLAPLLAILLAPASGAPARAEGEPPLAEAVRALLAEADPVQRTMRIVAIAGTNPAPADVAEALRSGRRWPADAPRGVVSWRRETPGGPSTVFAFVPKAYDPAKAWPVLVWLHGGVSRPEDGGGETAIPFLSAGAEEKGFLVLAPSGREGAVWWSPAGTALVRGALDDLARRYRVDPDRVLVSGHSDGGSACFHLLAHDPDPYAAFAAVMPNPLVTQAAGGPLFAANLAGRPIYAVNGGRDALYPAARMKAPMEALRAAGLDLTWEELPEFGHDGRAFFEKGEEILAFWRDHPRNAWPERVGFETPAPEREGRRAWVELLSLVEGAPSAEGFPSTAVPLVVTPRPRLGIRLDTSWEGEGARIESVEPGSPAAEAGFAPGDVLRKAGDVAIASAEDLLALRDYLESLGGAEGTFTVERGGQEVVLRAAPKAAREELDLPAELGYGRPSARVEAHRVAAGRIEVRTRNVGALRLHLAPPLWQPGERLVVVVNGKIAWEGVPAPDVAEMLASAVRGGPLAPVVFASLTLRVE